MTSARIQPFRRKYNINVGCYDGFRVYRRSIAERNTTLKIHENHFCWNSDGISFDKAIKELEVNFKLVDNVINDKHVKTSVKYEYEPKKVQSELKTMIVYDIETFNTDRSVPYANCIYRLSKISGKFNRDITEYETC